MSNTPSNRPKKDDKDDSLKDKFNETLNNLKKNEHFDAVYQYAQENTRDTVAYIVLILGILLIFFKPFWGGLLVGLVVGIYFYNEILAIFQDLNGFIEAQGMVRSLILGGIAVAFFISAPMIFIGAALAVGVKYFIGSSAASGH